MCREHLLAFREIGSELLTRARLQASLCRFDVGISKPIGFIF
jgi:hypothetical protein